MWLLAVQLIAALIASVRGFRALPWVILAVPFIIGIAVALSVRMTLEIMSILNVMDYVVAGVLIIMALVGARNSPPPDYDEQGTAQRVPCPHCAELIKPTAKVCRYCGREL